MASRSPPFRLESGDGKEISLHELTGNIVLCFNETEETQEKNWELKNDFEFFKN